MVLLIHGPEFTIGHRIISRHLEARRRTGSARRVLAVERRVAKSRTAMHKEQARGGIGPTQMGGDGVQRRSKVCKASLGELDKKNSLGYRGGKAWRCILIAQNFLTWQPFSAKLSGLLFFYV